MARKRGGLRRNALHQVAVADDCIDAVVDHGVIRPVVSGREEFLCNRHSHAVSESLTQWARCGFDSGDVRLGMPGCLAFPLPEILDVVKREVVAGKMEEAVEEHTAVPR